MSTITKERVTGIARGEKCYTHDDVVELARIALASLEAEAVAWRYRTTDINGNPNPRWSFSEDASLLGLYQPLYTAPPAPLVSAEIAVALITAIEKEQDRLFWQDYLMDSKDCIDVIREEMERLNARCATALQGEAGNSPVIPDGWVACSERMPETYVNVLLTDEHDDVCIGQMEFEGDIYFYVAGYPNRYKATHWMPLPAAPQQK